jgi:hypothetical protein
VLAKTNIKRIIRHKVDFFISTPFKLELKVVFPWQEKEIVLKSKASPPDVEFLSYSKSLLFRLHTGKTLESGLTRVIAIPFSANPDLRSFIV